MTRLRSPHTIRVDSTQCQFTDLDQNWKTKDNGKNLDAEAPDSKLLTMILLYVSHMYILHYHFTFGRILVSINYEQQDNCNNGKFDIPK